MAKEIDKIVEGMQPRQAKYWRAALTFMRSEKADQTWELKPGTGEWRAWRLYFERHCGFVPCGMGYAENSQIKFFLVPARWPTWFDASFAEPTA
jgi:hypothetical protein